MPAFAARAQRHSARVAWLSVTLVCGAAHAQTGESPLSELAAPTAPASAPTDAIAVEARPGSDSAGSVVSTSEQTAVIDVEVRSERADAGKRLAGSSAAVLVVDTKQAQAEAADLGAVLARQQGVNLQRAGGLGAQTRISLQGLGEDQIRFYVDGVPLAFTGLPENIAYVPVDLVARAEIYRGVVPIRFGGDTLSGAIHLATHEPRAGAHGSASISLGAFDTQRGVLRAQLLDTKSHFYASVASFLDHARNDYPMDDVLVTQRDGKRTPRRVYRLHDGYRAGYGQLELGLIDHPLAKRLIVRGFASGYDKEINHDLLMNNPYGQVLSQRRAEGVTLLHEHKPTRAFAIDTRLGYAHRTRGLRDRGSCAYDWYRNCVAALPNGGEIFGLPADRRTDEHDAFLRLLASYRASPLLQLRASLAPTYTTSRARDTAVGAGVPDLFAQDRKLFGLTAGLEHELDAFAGRLENVLFVKDYVQWLSADATTTQGMVALSQLRHRVGVGNSVRVRPLDSLLLKASYELGTRLPGGDEVFGDGSFIEANLALVPERSHNLNLELRWSHEAERVGAVSLSVLGFFRQVEDFIFLLPGPTVAQYHNLADAQLKGVEGAARYVTPGEYLAIEGNATWQDTRNQATRGPLAPFEGERIPNRPYLFANLSVTGKLKSVAGAEDALSLSFRESYVAEFFRAFEVAHAEERGAVPTQLVSSLVLTYEAALGGRELSASFEANNLTDASVYDFFGVQRPGRYAIAKLMLRI